MVGKASAAEPWPRLTVNNFVAARGEPIRMANELHVPVSVNRFSRPGGPGLLTCPRPADLEVGDTAGLEACATGKLFGCVLMPMKYPGQASLYLSASMVTGQ
jgi:hypothetical protein